MATYELEEFFDAVANERDRQIGQHGYNRLHDDLHSDADWLAIMDHYLTGLGRAISHMRWLEMDGVEAGEHKAAEDRVRRSIVKIGALSCAWHESLGRRDEGGER